MGKRADSKRAQLEAILREQSPAIIDAAFCASLKRRLEPISESYVRQLLKQTGVPLAPLVEGLSLHTLEDLERTLLALQREYDAADSLSRHRIRLLVIEGKNRARWSLKKASPEMASIKREMLLWVMTWLENPGAFPAWLTLRKKSAAPGH